MTKWITQCAALLTHCLKSKTDWNKNVLSSCRGRESSPHGVQERPVILQPQQLVGCGHVVCNGLFPIQEEGVGGPDVAGQQVIQSQHLHRAFEAKPLVLPALTKKDINGVFLQKNTELLSQVKEIKDIHKAVEWVLLGVVVVVVVQ